MDWYVISTPIELVNTIKLHRRNNIIYTYTSILFDIKRNEIQMWVDAGRPCRPLFYLDEGKPTYLNDNVKRKLNDGTLTWREMFCGFDSDYTYNSILNMNKSIKSEDKLNNTKAVIDYIDASEGEGIRIAKSILTTEQIINSNNTHVEIHPSLILGFMANQVIFPEHNPYPRDAFSCGQINKVFPCTILILEIELIKVHLF